MPKRISIADAIEKNKINSNVAFLVLLNIEIVDPDTGNVAETLYLVRNDEDITYNEQLYTKASFEFKYSSQSGEIPEVSVSIVDYQNAIQAYMQEYNGGVGSHITVTVVNSNSLTEPADLIEFFDVISASAANYVIQWRLGAENPLSVQFPGRIQNKDKCTWLYKGAECLYVGGITSCDLSLDGPNGCVVHDNRVNFGAFPGINRSNIRYA